MYKNHLFQKIGFTLILFSSLIISGGCGGGGGGGELTLVSITDGWGNTVQNGSTNVNPSSFTIKFSGNVDATMCSGEDVTASCVYGTDTPLVPSYTVAVSPTDPAACVVTVADAWEYSQMTCTVTYRSAAASVSSKAAIDTSYTFTNACAVSDDFNADSQSCWAFATGSIPADWATAINDGITLFDTGNSSLDISIQADETVNIGALKSAASNPSELTIIYTISDLGTTRFEDNEAFSFGIIKSRNIASAIDSFNFGVGGFRGPGQQDCFFFYYVSDVEVASDNADCSGANIIYVRFTANASNVLVDFKLDDGEWTPLDMTNVPTSLEALLASLTGPEEFPILGFGLRNHLDPTTIHPVSGKIQSIEFSGLSVEGMY